MLGYGRATERIPLMSRHLADHRMSAAVSRLRPFLSVERRSGEEGSHPTSRELAKRSKDALSARRVKEFMRIERGRTV